MPLDVDEIRPGIVAYFDVATLVQNPEIRVLYGTIPPRSGPFLCIRHDDDRSQSTWIPITTQRNVQGNRIPLDGEQWQHSFGRLPQSYASDAWALYEGPDWAFAAASAGQDNVRGARPALKARPLLDVAEKVLARMLGGGPARNGKK